MDRVRALPAILVDARCVILLELGGLEKRAPRMLFLRRFSPEIRRPTPLGRIAPCSTCCLQERYANWIGVSLMI